MTPACTQYTSLSPILTQTGVLARIITPPPWYFPEKMKVQVHVCSGRTSCGWLSNILGSSVTGWCLHKYCFRGAAYIHGDWAAILVYRWYKVLSSWKQVDTLKGRQDLALPSNTIRGNDHLPKDWAHNQDQPCRLGCEKFSAERSILSHIPTLANSRGYFWATTKTTFAHISPE